MYDGRQLVRASKLVGRHPALLRPTGQLVVSKDTGRIAPHQHLKVTLWGPERVDETMRQMSVATPILSCALAAGCTARQPAALAASQYARLGPSHSSAMQEHLSQPPSAGETLDDQVGFASDAIGQVRAQRTPPRVHQASHEQGTAATPKPQEARPIAHASLSPAAPSPQAAAPGGADDKHSRWRAEDEWFAQREAKAKQAIAGVCRTC
jgi:hypothetical protein